MAFSEVTKKKKSIFNSKHMTVKKSHLAPCINDFDIIKPISRGAFGQVYLARKNDSSKLYALKSMKKKDVRTKNMMDQVVAERDALAISSKSPFVVQLFYSFQSQEKIFLVMEYMIGGDVKSLLHNLGYFEETMAKFYVAEVVLALQYLHSHSIYHRDIKPDNMLLSDTGHVKLTDFGLSCLTSDRKPNFLDLINTPGGIGKDDSHKDKKIFWRTPGQLQSLTSKFNFSVPRNAKTHGHRKSIDELSVILSATSGSKEFLFSSPQFITETSVHSTNTTSHIWTPQLSKIASTPNINDQPSAEKGSVAGASSTGITSDVCGLTLENLRGKRKLAIQESTEKENNGVRKRVRVYSQSLPSELEVSTDVSQFAVLNDRTNNRVSFGNPVQSEEVDSCLYARESHIEDVLHSSGAEVSGLQLDLSFSTNLSGVTALTDTSHMNVSVYSSGMLTPHDAENKLQMHSCSNVKCICKLTPSPSQTKQHVDKYSPSLTPKTVYIRERRNSDAIFTPVQALQFFEGTPEICSYKDNVLSADIAHCLKKTPDSTFGSEYNIMKTPKQTPFRTPKSCLRGKATLAERRRILGTPDYLAPEILLGKPYGAPVDWWALGICFYEFLTGIPPFNDDSPELVFEHILDHDMIWPEDDECLSENVVSAIKSMLTVDPDSRPQAEQIKDMPCFTSIDWKSLLNQTAPFIPQPDDIYDTTYFQAKNLANHWQISTFKP